MIIAFIATLPLTGMVQLEFNPHLQSASTLASSSNTEVLVWDTDKASLVAKWKVHSRPVQAHHAPCTPVQHKSVREDGDRMPIPNSKKRI